MAEGDLDGGPSNSEKRDARVNISRMAGSSVLSKWLERSPLMSYPRPWCGKLTRIKSWTGCPGLG
jgi:hypothetical protein